MSKHKTRHTDQVEDKETTSNSKFGTDIQDKWLKKILNVFPHTRNFVFYEVTCPLFLRGMQGEKLHSAMEDNDDDVDNIQTIYGETRVTMKCVANFANADKDTETT